MLKPPHAFLIARIDRLRELLEGSNFGSPAESTKHAEPAEGCRSGRAGPDASGHKEADPARPQKPRLFG